jgi:hypothetical protein
MRRSLLSYDDWKLQAPPIDDLILTEVIVFACCGRETTEEDRQCGDCLDCGIDNPGFKTIKEYK